jgi:phosphatidate cytidylyltransferase
MSSLDPPNWSEPAEHGHHDAYPGRQGGRHLDAAPDAYPGAESHGDRDAEFDLGFHVDFGRPARGRGRRSGAGTPDGTRPERRPLRPRRGSERHPPALAPAPPPGQSGEPPDWADATATAEMVAVSGYPPGDGAAGVGEPAAQPWADEPAAQPWADEPVAQPWADEPVAQPWADEPAAPPWADETATQSWVGEPAAQPWTDETAAQPRVGEPAAQPWTDETAVQPWAGKPVADGPAHTGATRSADEPRAPRGRAGRDLPAAIGVGLTLGAIVIASLSFWRPAFVAVAALATCVATWEMARAVRPSGAHPPMVPLVAGGVAMAALAWFGGAEALTLGLVTTVVAALVWRLSDGPAGYQRDIVAALLIAVYVPFLGGFAVLLLRPEDGALRVFAALAGVVLSDTGGYIAGVFLGRHPMAPTVSPKKSWEGFAGSLVATGAGGALMLYLMFDVAPWYGAVFGLSVSVASVLGDLAESMLKRDLKIKDMSNLLPGHGGLMDRLDSILFALPTAYAVLTLVAPVLP